MTPILKPALPSAARVLAGADTGAAGDAACAPPPALGRPAKLGWAGAVDIEAPVDRAAFDSEHPAAARPCADLGPEVFEERPAVKSLDGREWAGGMEEVRRHMAEGLSFEEARLELVRGQMRRFGVDESGMPSDPKAFTFQQAGKQRARPGGATAGRPGTGEAKGDGGGFAKKLHALPALMMASQARPPRRSLSDEESAKWDLQGPGVLGVAGVARMRRADKWFLLSALLFLAVVPLVMFRLESWASPRVPRTLVQEARPRGDAIPLWPPAGSPGL